MPRAFEQATSSSSVMAARSNSLRGNLTLRLWTWDSQDGADGDRAAEFTEDLVSVRSVGPVARRAGGFGVVRLGLRTPARAPGKRSFPLTTAFFSPALWSRAARPTTLAFFVRRMEAECIAGVSLSPGPLLVLD